MRQDPDYRAELPPGSSRKSILGVPYVHLRLSDGADLYVTEHGLPFIENLKPENFLTDKDWFNRNSTKLSGT
ncbi:hypothetical protein ACFL01_02510, partial [Planctomycetota bacterium]